LPSEALAQEGLFLINVFPANQHVKNSPDQTSPRLHDLGKFLKYRAQFRNMFFWILIFPAPHQPDFHLFFIF
jgi:hypothetical protein